jgi:hypothetical protein
MLLVHIIEAGGYHWSRRIGTEGITDPSMQELAPSLYTLSMAHILEVYSKSVMWRRKIHRKVERRGKYTWIVSRSLSPCPWSKETGHIQSAKIVMWTHWRITKVDAPWCRIQERGPIQWDPQGVESFLKWDLLVDKNHFKPISKCYHIVFHASTGNPELTYDRVDI